MSTKKILTITAVILFILALACIIVAVVTGINKPSDPDVRETGDITTEEYQEPDVDPELAFLTEHRWIRNINCEEHITFARDGYFGYSCSCGSPVDNYDLYDSFEYEDGVVSVRGTDEEDALMRVVYYDMNYLCLYLEEEGECRVFVDEDFANDPFAPSQETYAGEGWLAVHIMGYNGDSLTFAPYNYDGDAKKEFEEYTKEIPTVDNIEFYDVSTVDDNGEVTTEHFKLSEEDIGHIGEYFTAGYAHFNTEGIIDYMVFYGKTIIQG